MSGVQASATVLYVLHISHNSISSLGHSPVCLCLISLIAQTLLLVLLMRLLIAHWSITLERWGIVHCGGWWASFVSVVSLHLYSEAWYFVLPDNVERSSPCLSINSSL